MYVMNSKYYRLSINKEPKLKTRWSPNLKTGDRRLTAVVWREGTRAANERGADRSADWRRSPTLLTTRGLNSRYHLQILLSVLLPRSLPSSFSLFHSPLFIGNSFVPNKRLFCSRSNAASWCLYTLLDFLFCYCWLHTKLNCLCVQFCMQSCCGHKYCSL